MAIRRILGTALAGALAFGTVACTGTTTSTDKTSSSTPDKSKAAQKPDKFAQTWKKPYGKTTCDDWSNSMNQHENFVAAADMLINMQHVDDPSSGLPSDALISDFKGGITTDCVVPTLKLNEVAAALYVTEKPTFKP